MDRLLEKISEYDILNYLFPGVIFICFIDILGIYSIKDFCVFQVLFLGYLAGMVVSRIGSIIIEPSFKWLKIVEYAPYDEYRKAEAKVPKITILVTQNNMYRSLVAMFSLLLVLYSCRHYSKIRVLFSSPFLPIWGINSLLLLFIFAYRKQTSYVRERVKQCNSVDDK